MDIFLLVRFPVAMNGENQVFRQGVDDRYANPVQPAGYLVRVVIKFTAGMQNGHDDLGRRAALFRVQVNRYAAAIIADRNGFIRMDRDRDRVAMTGERLIDGVVDNLEDHVVQAGAVISVADVHARPFSNGLQAL